MSIFDHRDFDDHEQIVFCRDRHAGLQAIIAIHDTSLGPAAGGCRMWRYGSEEEALRDVLRLSRAMSYKNAFAGLPLGGGKSVIIGDPRSQKAPALLQSFGKFIERLGGRYYAAEDVGIDIDDVATIRRTTRYAFGVAGGDPSPYTARGGFEGIRAAVKHRFGADSLQDITVALQGVGHVGMHLCRLLHDAGAKLVVADPNAAARNAAVDRFAARVATPEGIYGEAADVFAPCALGGTINRHSIPQLRARIVAGVANNQLATAQDGEELRRRNILYAPDYVINAGGMHQASREIFGDYSENEVMSRITGIYCATLRVFAEAEKRDEAPNLTADRMARELLVRARATNTPGNDLPL